MPIQYATADSFRRVTGQQLKPILEILAQVTWPVPEAKIPALIDQLGWTWLSNRVHIEADTCLPLNYAIGDFAKPDGELSRTVFYLSDMVSTDDAQTMAVMQAAYPDLAAVVQSVLGEPSGAQTGEDTTTWWDLPTEGRFNVDARPSRIQGVLLSKLDADVDRFYQAHPQEDYPELYED
jgi:hypothetical protein